MLILEIPESYRNVDEQFLDEEDVEILASLLNVKMEDSVQQPLLYFRILSNIRWACSINLSRATEIICELFKKGNQDWVLRYSHELRRVMDQIDLSQWNPEGFREILLGFEDLPMLNSDAVFILAKFGEKEPLGLIQFFARRVEKELENGKFFDYQSIPISAILKEIATVYQGHFEYTEAIDQIMEWFQKDDFRWKYAAANLISGISPKIHGRLKETLSEMTKNGDERDLGIVLMVLEKFPEDPVLETLCKDAVRFSQGKRKLQDRVEVFLLYTLRGRTTNQVREILHIWRDDENVHVSGFSKRAIKNWQTKIENDQKWNAEHEMKRRKGV